MPLHALPDDFYDYHESNNRLEGRHTGWLFAAGDEVKVKIIDVTAISGGILLDWVDGGRIDKSASRNRTDGAGHHHPRHAKRRQNDQANQKDANADLTFCGFTAGCAQFSSDSRKFGKDITWHKECVMAKPATLQIKLLSTADTGYYYVTKKNPRTKPEKLELKKYDPRARKHVIFRESKIK